MQTLAYLLCTTIGTTWIEMCVCMHTSGAALHVVVFCIGFLYLELEF